MDVGVLGVVDLLHEHLDVLLQLVGLLGQYIQVCFCCVCYIVNMIQVFLCCAQIPVEERHHSTGNTMRY